MLLHQFQGRSQGGESLNRETHRLQSLNLDLEETLLSLNSASKLKFSHGDTFELFVCINVCKKKSVF